jgi:hypothetical protein
VGRYNSPEGDQNRAKRHREAQASTAAADHCPRSRRCNVWLQATRFVHCLLDARPRRAAPEGVLHALEPNPPRGILCVEHHPK